MMSDPPSSCVCSRRLILLWGPIASCTHDPRIYAHIHTYLRIHIHKQQLYASSNRLPFFILFSEISTSPFLRLLAMDHFIALVLPETETRWPPTINRASQLSHSLTFSWFQFGDMVRRSFTIIPLNRSTFVRKKSLATERTSNESGTSFSRLGKWKRRPEVKWAVWIMSMHRAFHEAHLEKMQREETWEKEERVPENTQILMLKFGPFLVFLNKTGILRFIFLLQPRYFTRAGVSIV